MVWQRARSEDQKEVRRRALLEAAARLHASHPLEEISLSRIARAANVSKANVYRYFGSREELFLELMREALEAWRDVLVRRLEALAGGEDPDALARAFAVTVVEHPRFARLAAVLTTVLERNVGVDAVAAFKRSFVDAGRPLREAIRGAFPSWSEEQAQHLLELAYHLLVALWPAAHPAPAVAQALERPELAGMRMDFEEAYAAALVTVARGVGSG
ncbi:MAG: TetR/AcrR family transcriptional regulator [Sandaracinaceae bacterium]